MSASRAATNEARCASEALSDPDECQPLDLKRIQGLWRRVERYTAGVTVRAEGRSKRLIVVSGWAAEMRILPDGRRQIFGCGLPGDVIDLSNSGNLGNRAFVALTRLEVVDAEVMIRSDGVDGAQTANAIERALRRREDALYEQIVRIGRLNAKERILNLLLDLHDRLSRVGLVKEGAFRVPITQEMFADSLGLSLVHINRTLQQLRREGLLDLRGGAVTLRKNQRLTALACYQPASAEWDAVRSVRSAH